MNSSLDIVNMCSAYASMKVDKIPSVNDVGETVQRQHVIKQLPGLYEIDQQACLERVFPLVQKALRRNDVALHAEAAVSFLQLLQSHAFTSYDFVIVLLPSIVRYMDQGDEAVCNVWIKLFLELIDTLPPDSLRSNIFQIAVAHSQLNSPPYQRVGAAKLLGRMCARLEKLMVMKDILPIIHSLSQDTNHRVRASACQQLHLLAKELPDDVIRSSVIPNIIELARDEDEFVRGEAVEVISHMIPNLPDSTLRSTILPLVLSICEKVHHSFDDSIIRLCSTFANLCHGLNDVLSADDKMRMIKEFCELSTLGTPNHWPKKGRPIGVPPNSAAAKLKCIECRRLCAENLPSMVRFGKSDIITRKLLRVLADFSVDPSPIVRKVVASNIHEVTGMVGERVKVGKRVFMDLLKDKNIDVLTSLAPNISVMVNHLNCCGVFSSDHDPARIEVATAICNCAATAGESLNWRLMEDVHKQMECMVKLVTSDYIYANHVPRMFDVVLNSRVKPVQLAATRTLLTYLRYNLKPNQRQKIRSRLDHELCRSESCHKRMSYLKLCDLAISIYSSEYFGSHFLTPLLSLSHDPVANNRIVFANLLPRLFKIVESNDKLLLEFDKMLNLMTTNESDTDVKDALLIATTIIKDSEKMSQIYNQEENTRKLDEEKKLTAIMTNIIALRSIKDTNGTVSSRGASYSFRSPLTRQSTLDTHATKLPSNFSSKSRCQHTNHACTCYGQPRRISKSSHDLEISWLNLEMDHKFNKLLLLSRRDCSCPSLIVPSVCVFSTAFERDFYRDAGVHVVDIVATTKRKSEPAREQPPPIMLAQTGRSKSFVLPSSNLTEQVTSARPTVTRIPISGGRNFHRRSMDVSQLSRAIKTRSHINGAASGSHMNSRLPVRNGRIGI